MSALIAGPLLCAALFFRLEAPGQDPGVYLETDRGPFEHTLLETDRGLYTLSGYAADQVGASGEAALKTPVPPSGTKRLAFYIVGPRDSPLGANAPSATLWCFVVDGVDDGFRASAVRLPATIHQINPRAYRVTSDELENLVASGKPGSGWAPERVAFQQYQRALARTTRPRTTMEVLIGLEIQDSAAGPRRMYSVRVGPPQ